MEETFCFLGAHVAPYFFPFPLSQSFVLVGLEAPCHPLSRQIIKGYYPIERLAGNLKVMPIVTFDSNAIAIFRELKSQGIEVATMDLRIASIALDLDLILLTRNVKDFQSVPQLLVEDWTV
jgi:hypothetical protein